MAEDEVKPEDGQVCVVKNSLSEGVHTAIRGADGKFKKSRNKIEAEVRETEKIQRDLKALLARPAKNEKGEAILGHDGKPIAVHLAAAQRLLEMVANLKDERAIGSAAKALESIMTRAFGPPPDNAQTRESLLYGGIRVVVLTQPDVHVVTPEEEKAEEERKKQLAQGPSWVRGELVEQNHATNKDVIEEESDERK